MLQMYDTKKFTDIYDNAEEFKSDYLNNGIPAVLENEETVETLFYLLYARFGNNPIANYDETQFKYKIFSIIWQYGPSWEKRLQIQSKLRSLSEEDIISGTKMIYNHAFNPSSSPSTATLEELQAINDQNTSKVKKGVIEAYTQLWEMIATDVTNEFLNRFQNLFKTFVKPEQTHIYVTEVDEDE